jgi:hypothetical protein
MHNCRILHLHKVSLKRILMKKQSLSISIPEPCHEKWSKMNPAEQGRHCLSCQKTVVDFTSMPKVKIAEYVSEHQGKMCGRFTSDQLNVELIPPKPSKSWLKYAAIILGLVPTIGYGQEVKSKTTPVPTHVIDDLQIGDVEVDIPITGEMNVIPPPKQAQTKIVSGILVDDESGEPIVFGTVALYHDDILITGIETDMDGRFTIEDPTGKYNYISASYIGYESRKIEIADITADKELTICLKEGDLLMGIVEVFGWDVPRRIDDKKVKKNNSRELEKIESVKSINQTVIQSERNDRVQHLSPNQLEERAVLPEMTLPYQLPIVEIVQYREPQVETGYTSIVTTGIVFYVEERENWLESLWRTFKSLVVGSHDEAVKNREPDNTQVAVDAVDESDLDRVTSVSKEITPTLINNYSTQIKVFPNPTSGHVNITIPAEITGFDLKISDMKNELVFSKAYNYNPNTLDFTSLVPGAYIVSIIHQDKLIYSDMLVKM